MKRPPGIRRFPASIAAFICGFLPAIAHSADLYWDGTGTLWEIASSWSTSPSAATPNPAAGPNTGDVAHFNIDTLTDSTATVRGNRSALGLVFNSSGTTLLQAGPTSNWLSLGASGITINPGAGPVAINLNGIGVTANQSWTNHSANTFAVSSYLELGRQQGVPGRTLTVDGSGNTSLTGAINVSSYIVKNGAGTLTIGGPDDNIGFGIIANAGTVVLDKASVHGPGFNIEVHAIGALSNTIAGGTVQLAGTGGDQFHDACRVTLTSGTLDMNGRNETFRGLSLAGSGASGTGALVNNDAGTTTTLTLNFEALSLTADATIGGSGDLALAAGITGSFGLTKTGPGTLYLSRFSTYTGGTTITEGVVSASQNSYLGDASGPVSIESAGRLRISGSNTTSRTFNVSGGTLEITGTSSLQLNSGQLINNGVVIGSISINNASLAKGTGTYDVVRVNDGGTLAPGNSIGIATATSVQFDGSSATNGDPVLAIELAGTGPGAEYDQLHATGQLSLAGTLEVSLINGFTPIVGDSFDILDFGNLSGAFSMLSLPALDADLMWNASQLYATGTLSVSIAGDYNNDSSVDAADYVTWRKGLGSIYEQEHYAIWRANFGRNAGNASAATAGLSGSASSSVPEPSTAGLLALAVLLSAFPRHVREFFQNSHQSECRRQSATCLPSNINDRYPSQPTPSAASTFPYRG